ncbi:MAG: tRNA lysidine(34) synthetase TilS [Spirochaetales bacterium]|nr:tRNA lysidine(34) synthetase TilS [Spirochaetales bacterium]
MKKSRLISIVESELRSFSVLPGERLLLALSGGADSMALAMILYELKPRWGFELFAAHLNHGIRPHDQCLGDWNLIQNQCSSVFTCIYYESLESGYLRQRSRDQKKSLEEVARTCRFDFFYRCLDKCKARFLLLAHHRDDQEETMVMRFFQGSSPSGLKGISPKRGVILRPLLGVRKKDLIDFLDSLSIKYSFDSTNDDQSILRNHLRHHLVPEIKKVFPGMSRALSRITFFMSEMADFIEHEAGQRIIWQKISGGYQTSLEIWNRQPFLIKLQSLWALSSSMIRRSDQVKLPFDFFNPLKKIYPNSISRTLLKGYGVELKIEGDQLVFRPELVLNIKNGYFIKVYPGMELDVKGTVFKIYPNDSIISVKSSETKSFCCLDLEAHNQVILRSRKIGDKIELKNGRKSLKKLYNEWKIPETERWLIPILENSKGISAVLGKSFGYDDIFSLHYNERVNKQARYILKIFKDGVISK